MSLEKLGWNNYFVEQFKPYADQGIYPGRVITQHKGLYMVYSEKGTINCKLSGKFMYRADIKKDYPAVGDWVVIKLIDDTKGVIHDLLPRKSYFSRKLPISGGRKIKNGVIVGGNIEEQIIGSNIDTVFIVCGQDNNFNIHRIERYITLAHNSSVTPVIFLNKCDLSDHTTDYMEQTKKIAKNIAIHSISVLKDINMEIFNDYICSGKTVVFLGSSGVGKSTIINYLFGDMVQKTSTVSNANGKGRHTTTASQLLQHESGCSIIDTPGIKELQLWANEDVLSESFQDIYALAEQCKYRDCKHDKEVGCAIKAALEAGKLSVERLNSYKNQLKELRMLEKSRKNYDYGRVKKVKKKYKD